MANFTMLDRARTSSAETGGQDRLTTATKIVETCYREGLLQNSLHFNVCRIYFAHNFATPFLKQLISDNRQLVTRLLRAKISPRKISSPSKLPHFVIFVYYIEEGFIVESKNYKYSNAANNLTTLFIISNRLKAVQPRYFENLSNLAKKSRKNKQS